MKVALLRIRGLLALWLAAVCCFQAVTWSAEVGTTSVTVDAALVGKTQSVTGRATVSTAQAGSLQVTIDWVDNYGRVVDRQVSTLTLPAQTSVTYSFATQVGLTLLNRISVSAVFPSTGDTLSGSSVNWELIPDPMDLQDYHANVWGDGATSSSAYFTSIAQANVDLGHIYRNASFYGPTYNVRPNHDFIEDKKWFEMTDAMHDPNYNVYNPALVTTHDYYLPSKRSALVRPQSLSSTSSLNSLINTITPRMQATRKWRPMQWNIADEYGLGRRDYPFDYDLGPDCISQFITWLQGQYGTIGALNAQWGTGFSSFSDLSDPINAPQYGEAALIITQEMKDREYPLYEQDTAAKNFSPWSDFRRHMELTMANAMQLCVNAARGIDATVPIGWEGGETVSPLNGYDYWLQMRKMGSYEAYDLSNSPELARSFRDNQYGEKLFRWITMFNSGSATRNRYRLWFDMIHYGHRASIIWWNQDFFNYPTSYDLTSYATGLAPAYGEFRAGLAKLLSQGEPDDGQIALYYSQRSAHASWMYDSEPYGYTWLQQKSNDRSLQTILYGQTGWLKALEDIGLKGRFVSYEQIANGELISRGYKVLIMSRIMAMSPEEIAAVQAFANAGGLVIADSQTALYDGHCKRRSIADGGGLMDTWFGIERMNYRSTERNKESSDAYAGTVSIQTPPAGFEALVGGLGATVDAGWHAVEDGVRVLDGAAVGLFGNDPAKPVLIVKNHGAGKSVYMNVTLMRYGRSGSNYTDERRSPSSAAARNVRQLVRNLAALGGVTAKVRVLQGYNADPQSGTEVYNLEKARFVDGQAVYLACVLNSQIENQDLSTVSNPGGTFFGQPGVTNAQVTLVLDQPAHVYDVRTRAYLGYGTQINAIQPVLEGGVFALLPYQVQQVRIDSLSFDAKQRATVRASVRPQSGSPGRHVLRLIVRDGAAREKTYLTRNVIATDGVWQDVVPFAVTENLQGWTITLTDMATGLSASVPAATLYGGDVNRSGHVDVSDLLLLAGSWGKNRGDAGYDLNCDINSDGAVDAADLLLVAADWGL
jgi:hypothetical protein